MAEICRQVTAELAALRGGGLLAATHGRSDPIEEELALVLAGEGSAAWVGTLRGVIVGYAVAGLRTFADGSRVGVISDLYVERGARGVGVGECLVADVVSWCAANRCVGVDAAALPGNRAAKNFFEESGFTARLLIMHRPLDAEGGDA